MWSQPHGYTSHEKKLDYISLFGEDSKPDQNFVKIYAKKKHEVPGPQAYKTDPKWIYHGRKCKFLPTDRVTDTEEIIQAAKRAKTPGPNHYKAKHNYTS